MSSNGNRILVMLGVDSERKSHAARFNPSDEAGVRKAAGLMNMRLGVAKTDKALALAHKLPEGKLFESGKGMVPLVREEAFYELCTSLTFDESWTTAGIVTGTDAKPDTATLKASDTVWATIKIGSTVLAFDPTDPEIPGWGAAVVTAIAKNGETLTARWRDFPGFKPFTVERHLVGLLRPGTGS